MRSELSYILCFGVYCGFKSCSHFNGFSEISMLNKIEVNLLTLTILYWISTVAVICLNVLGVEAKLTEFISHHKKS